MPALLQCFIGISFMLLCAVIYATTTDATASNGLPQLCATTCESILAGLVWSGLRVTSRKSPVTPGSANDHCESQASIWFTPKVVAARCSSGRCAKARLISAARSGSKESQRSSRLPSSGYKRSMLYAHKQFGSVNGLKQFRRSRNRKNA